MNSNVNQGLTQVDQGVTQRLTRGSFRFAPGFIQTDMTQGLIDEEIPKKIPLQRVGSVEDVASLINFLVSEESNYITGQTLVVDGGLFMK